MRYNFGNMDDKALRELARAVFAEEQKRVKKAIADGKWPKPTLTGDKIADIKRYRTEQCCDLLVAKFVVEHYS